MCRFQKISRPLHAPRRELEIPGGLGGGGVRGPGNSIEEGGWTIKSLSRGQYHFIFDLSSNIASYRPGRSFSSYRPGRSFFLSSKNVLDVISKELNQLQLILSHAHIFSCHYSLPVSLKTSTHAAHHVTSVDRWKNSRVAILLLEAQTIHCNHFRMWSFYSPFHFPLIFWLKVWHVQDRILAEMVWISPNITLFSGTIHNTTVCVSISCIPLFF